MFLCSTTVEKKKKIGEKRCCLRRQIEVGAALRYYNHVVVRAGATARAYAVSRSMSIEYSCVVGLSIPVFMWYFIECDCSDVMRLIGFGLVMA